MIIINNGNIQPFTRPFGNFDYRSNQMDLISNFYKTSRPQDIPVSIEIPHSVTRTGEISSPDTNKFLNFNSANKNDYQNNEKIDSLFNYKKYFSSIFNSDATEHYISNVLTNENSNYKSAYWYSPEFNNYGYFSAGRKSMNMATQPFTNTYNYTFAGYTNYNSNIISIPNTVQELSHTFEYSSYIDTVYIPNSIKDVSSVFQFSRVKNITIEDNFYPGSIDWMFQYTFFIENLQFPNNFDYTSAWSAFAYSTVKFDEKYITPSLQNACFMFEGVSSIGYNGELNFKEKKLLNVSGMFIFENYAPSYYYNYINKNNAFLPTKVVFPDTLLNAATCFAYRKFNDSGTQVYFGNNVINIDFAFQGTQNTIYYNGLVPNSVTHANGLFNYATLHPNSENINYFYFKENANYIGIFNTLGCPNSNLTVNLSNFKFENINNPKSYMETNDISWGWMWSLVRGLNCVGTLDFSNTNITTFHGLLSPGLNNFSGQCNLILPSTTTDARAVINCFHINQNINLYLYCNDLDDIGILGNLATYASSDSIRRINVHIPKDSILNTKIYSRNNNSIGNMNTICGKSYINSDTLWTIATSYYFNSKYGVYVYPDL